MCSGELISPVSIKKKGHPNMIWNGPWSVTPDFYFFFVSCGPPDDLEIESRMSVSAWMFWNL